MQPLSLSIRIDATNPAHHLWNNNGTWWCHYTLHRGPRKQRCRVSLGTGVLGEALVHRDQLFAALLQVSASNQLSDSDGRPSAGRNGGCAA